MCKEKKTATVEEIAQMAEKLTDKQRGFVWNMMEFMMNTNKFSENADNFIKDLSGRLRSWSGKDKEAVEEEKGKEAVKQ